MIRIMIVEDHPLVAQGLAALLAEHGTIVDIVLDAGKVEDSILRNEPDLILLDLSMPERNGLELLPRIRRLAPGARVLVVTMHFDRTYAEMAFGAGADGFMPKEGSAGELQQAIEVVMAGKRYLSPRVGKKRFRRAGTEDVALERLTDRQREILELLAEGKTSVQVASDLGITPKTVEFHRAAMRRALGVNSEWGLIRYAILAGLGRPKR